MTPDAQEIWELVVQSNRAWLEGRPRDTEKLFDPDAVAVFGTSNRLVGREAIVRSYVEYVEAVRTRAFDEEAHSIDLFGDTAVVRYRFSVRYESDGAVHDEAGEEILVFVRRSGRWAAVWRTQIPVRS